jgi:xanthine dehydrogenase small subunit
MQGSVTDWTLFDPKTTDEALRLLHVEGPLVPMAGCTDLYVALNFGTLKAKRFINLWRLAEWRAIDESGSVLSIGALATYTDIIRSPLAARRVPMLVAAAREVGGVQIQNRGTLGGNIANASPAGDTLPVLAAAEAIVVLASASEQRRVPLLEFYTGYRRTVMRSDELITAIEIPRLPRRQWFRKVGTRAAQAISKVVMAGLPSFDGRPPRLAIGSVAPTVVRLPRTEMALAAGASIADAQQTLLEEIEPIDDIRSTADYRRRVAANLLARFWDDCRERRR